MQQNQNNQTNHQYSNSYQGQSSGPYHPDELTPQNNPKKKKKDVWGYALVSIISILLTASIFIVAIVAGIGPMIADSLTESITPVLPSDSSGQSISGIEVDENSAAAMEKFNVIKDLVMDNYYTEVTYPEIIDAMTSGMLEKLGSPYTYYMSPEDVAAMEESMSGVYSGIGATVEKVDTHFQISDIIEDSPAEKSGLMINDVFVSVDGKPAGDYEDVSALAADIRGKQGTEVELVMYRPSEMKEHTFMVERQEITNSSIHSKMINDEIGYIRITSFNDGVSDNFISALDELQEQGAKNIIFDLRNNGGGYVNEVLRMLDFLLPEGLLITEIGRRDGKEFEVEEYSDDFTGVPEDMKYVCLINGNSASASELFSGTLRDWNKALLVGENSFGKGVGTITKFLNDGSAIQITNFYYNLPSGYNVDEVGLEPDYEVELPEEVRNIIISRIDPKEDLQLQKAIELLGE